MGVDSGSSRGDRLILIGWFLLAALAAGAPPLRNAVRRPPHPDSAVIYARPVVDGPGALTWSPSKCVPAAVDGHLVSAEDSPEAPIPGWRGMLLGHPLDLNRADLGDLEALPGIGPETAAAIVSARRRLGGFRDLEDLLAVRGVGAVTLARLSPWLRLGPR